MSLLRRIFRGHQPRSAPAMTLEGVLGPNSALDDAAGIAVDAPNALAIASAGHLLFSSGSAIYALAEWNDAPRLWRIFERPVTALFASPGGLVAVGLADNTLLVLDPAGQLVPGWSTPADLATVNDGLFLSESELALVESGYGGPEDALARAAWETQPRGRVLLIGADSESRILAGGLHAPLGIACDDKRNLLVTELERARILDITGSIRQSGYPGYLGRLRQTPGGYVVTCLARRDPLIEFLKTEHDFVAEMRAKIRPHHWIAPRVDPNFSHDFPIEMGATRLFGEIKPWAPSFSYGLVISLDKALMPVGAAHSRANGRRHAITDALAWNGNTIAISLGSGELLNLGSGNKQS
ncbi:hypothetical protein [Dongia sp.]|uniref:hypothetical protein n=1 Tax=Dongia sp. TaxID=1977262 RepID=UPI0035B3161B